MNRAELNSAKPNHAESNQAKPNQAKPWRTPLLWITGPIRLADERIGEELSVGEVMGAAKAAVLLLGWKRDSVVVVGAKHRGNRRNGFAVGHVHDFDASGIATL